MSLFRHIVRSGLEGMGRGAALNSMRALPSIPLEDLQFPDFLLTNIIPQIVGVPVLYLRCLSLYRHSMSQIRSGQTSGRVLLSVVSGGLLRCFVIHLKGILQFLCWTLDVM